MKKYSQHPKPSTMRTLSIALFGLLCSVTALGQTPSENYVKTKTYKKPTTLVPNPGPTEVVEQVTYFDGLGRAIQKVDGRQSESGKDIVTHIEYDAYGRPQYEYLPYASNRNTLEYVDGATAKQETESEALYNGEIVYSRKFYEPSPLNRVLKQSAPGNVWEGHDNDDNDHTIKFVYRANEDNEVRFFKVELTYDSNHKLYVPTLNEDGYYRAGSLYKTITRDENWTSGDNHSTVEFKNTEGQVVLKRTYNANTAHDTYYVYDVYGNLTYVIPPKASISPAISATQMENLCYQYQYDDQNRMVAKKLPGKTWEFIVYDKLSRVVATGPAYNPFGTGHLGWMHTKYDAFGRVAYTLWREAENVINEDKRHTLQDQYDSSTTLFESLTGSNVDSYANPYSSSVFPQSDYLLLTVNFYDTYTFPGAPGSLPAQVGGNTVLTNCKGLQTGSWVRVLLDPGSTIGETSHTLYNYQGKVLKTHRTNYLGGYTITENQIDFIGQPLETKTWHRLSSIQNPVNVQEKFEYTPEGRLKNHTHTINNQPTEMLVANKYDALGKLIQKNVGGTDLVNYNGLQVVDFSYNILGWMTGINDVDALAQPNDPNDLFAFKINYTDVEVSGMNGVQPLYNGNISETFWRSYNDNVKRAYGYTYDDLNRMDEAFYQKPGLTAANINNYREKLTYDENGNILTLKRNGNLDNGIQEIEIDDLTYTYPQDSNQLLKVTDETLHPSGFEDDSTDGTLATDTTDDYAYDSMGNMVSDENKGIQEIKYNHLNLPTYIDLGGKGNILYIYDATGRKVRKLVQDDVLTQNKQVDYADGFQYENNILQFFPTAEGYASRLTTKIEQSGVLIKIPIEELPEDQFSYVYNYTDHLGNIRLSYSLDPDTQQLKIVEQNHYYPFGMRHTNYSGGRMVMVKDEELKRMAPATEEFLTYKYKYNGKEFQDELGLNFYDYGARNYDAALGRWMNIDPKAETSRRWNPYTYCYNNPLRFVDPDGMQATWKPDKNGNLIAEKGDNTKTLATYLDTTVDKAAKFKEIKNGKTTDKEMGKDHDYKEGDVVVLDNNMTDDIKQYQETGNVENLQCHEAVYPAVKGLEIDEKNAKVHNSLDSIVEGLSGKTASDFASGYSQSDSSTGAVFGKSITVFGDSAHSAVYYGTSKDGTNYYYSKNGGAGPPSIVKENELIKQYGEAKYFHPKS
ncbi:RHS repeat-associated core domain-containing protein [Flavobacterium sp. N1719]|uniref:RHS repeat-associated core domain-containing protein n=1 Tax=Flavobacterium sp. N1719 TaxID=2885633 RepID=UPI00222386DF|nr:RHS repeat-associated core domain-containing protein [Flavobacterium sp. N1719]